MILLKLRHTKDDVAGDNGEGAIIVHGVNTITNGGEYTICGRAIPDANINFEGWEAIGEEFTGSIARCECKDCLRVIHYFKRLR